MAEPYRIFFSHGSEDTFMVEEFLKPKVETSGAEVFLDKGEVNYGDNFREIVLNELGKCDELLVLFTKSSLRRAWVMAEVGATVLRKKRIVAVIYGISKSELEELGVMSLLGNIHLLDLGDFNSYLEQLKTRVKDKYS